MAERLGTADTQGESLAIAAILVVLLAVVAVGVKVFDPSGRREARAERLQNRITERLRDALGVVPITVVAYSSPSARAPLVIEVTGSVRNDALRAAILETVRREAAQTRTRHSRGGSPRGGDSRGSAGGVKALRRTEA